MRGVHGYGVAGPDIRVRVLTPRATSRLWPLLLAVGLAGAACGGGRLVSPDAGGAGGGALGGLGDIGGTGAGGSGAFDGGSLVCPIGHQVVACAPSPVGLGVALPAAGGGAFVSYLDAEGTAAVESWDATAGAWRVILSDRPFGPNLSPYVLRVDSQGRAVVAKVFMADNGTGGVYVAQFDGLQWTSLAGGAPFAARDGLEGYDLAIDALDRPVLLLTTPGDSFDGQLSVRRWEAGAWTRLDTGAINAMPAAYARLTIDSGDGVTPYVAYKPQSALETIVPMKLAGDSWTALPALTRGLNGDFDFAVAGGQMYVSYVDGATVDDARLSVAQGTPAGWSPGERLDAEIDRPVYATRILAVGPAASDVVVAWEATYPASGLDQVLIKRAPDWARVPDVLPLASGDMAGFAIAADPARIGVVWVNRAATPESVGYLERAR
jgi:hypothetical protein